MNEQEINSDVDQDKNELNGSEDDQSGDSEDDLQGIDRYWPPPTDEIVTIIGSQISKTLSAFTFNNAGDRFSAGGHDYQVQVWDFASLDKDMPTSVCKTQPSGQSIIKQLDFSKDDSMILVISGSCQAIVMARDGIINNSNQCPKGDQYISDMTNTKGHVQMLNDGCWNSKDESTFITCSNDATIRIWDVNKLSQQKTVIKTRAPATGLKSIPNVCKYSRDSLSLVAGCNDGSVLMWDTRRKFINTSACIRNAHFKGSEITGLDYSYNSDKICTRSDDESCKIWDIRQLKQPLATRNDLTTLYSTTECSFSPDDRFVITGTSCTKQEPGHFLVLDTQDLSTKFSLDIESSSVIRARWHPKINHIAYSCSNGNLVIACDSKRSLGGLLTSYNGSSLYGKGSKRKKYLSHQEGFTSSSQIKKIITPHSLPLFREDNTKSSFAKIRQDPKKSHKPEMPIDGASQGGRVKPAGSTLSSYIAQAIAKPKDDGGMNIRDRILRHAEEAEKEPFWVKPRPSEAKASAVADGSCLPQGKHQQEPAKEKRQT